MSLPELCIKRPVMTTLVMLAFLIFGAVGYKLLPVSDLPNVDFPTIQVTASLPGASPDTMASAVATPLEKQFTTIAGLDSMTSGSAQGVTQITLQFNLSRNIDAAAQDVQSAISVAQKQLPTNMPAPPSFQKVNPADSPILYLALTSRTLPLYTLDDYGETLMGERISTVSGVAQVVVYGSQKYAVRVQLDPQKLAAEGIGINDAAAAVADANVNLPTGTLYGKDKAFTVQATGQLNDAAAYRPVIIAYRNGSPVRLDELGRVVDSVENDKTAAWYLDNKINERSVVLAIQRQPGTNTVEVCDAIKKLLPMFQQQLPPSAQLNVMYDRSVSINDSVNDVRFTLLLTLLLVIMVIFLFLRNISATVIPSLALPIAIIGTFAVMYLLGYSLDNLSLMALTLSVGFVVDDAIVMLENIVRHMEQGKGVMEAALIGSREIGFTIISMTLALVAVFIPVLFMGGIVGRLFHEFAVTIAAAILISGLVSLTLTPMLCSRFLKHGVNQRHGKAYVTIENGFNWLLHSYERGLKRSLLHRRAVLVGSFIVLAMMFWLIVLVPKGFLPSEDNSEVFGFTEAAQDISFDSMVAHQQKVNAVLQHDPNVQNMFSTTGARGANGANTGIVFMHLKPPSRRNLDVNQVIEEMRTKLSGIVGMMVFLQNPPSIRVGGNLTKSQYQFTLQDANTDELYHWAPIMEGKMSKLSGLQDVTSDLELKNLQVNVEIDRDEASALGVTPQAVEDALYTAYGSRQISTIYAPNNEYQVIMELLPQYQRDPAALSLLYVRSATGQLVPLSAVARLTQSIGPLSINHTGQLPSVTISFNLKPGASIGDAVNAVGTVARTTLPATISTSFQGTAQAFQSSLSGLGMLLIMAVLVIYLVLGILYESFIHPITILSALPFAGFGALITLLIFHMELDIYSIVGIIMLIGLVKKNGIMMIDFALEAQRNEGKNAFDSIFEACRIRFRPIMMTSFAAFFGTLPIAIGAGAGAGSRRPLGLAVVGGLVFSQTLTLFVTPVIFLYMDQFQQWLSRRGHGKGSRDKAQIPKAEPELARAGILHLRETDA